MQLSIKGIFFSGLNKVLQILSLIVTITIWLIASIVVLGTLNLASNGKESLISMFTNSNKAEAGIVLLVLIILSIPLELILFGISVIIGKSIDALNEGEYSEKSYYCPGWSLYDFYALMSDVIFILVALPVEICLIVNISLWYSLLMYAGAVAVFILLGSIFNVIAVKEPVANENQSLVQEKCSHDCTGCQSNNSCDESPYLGTNEEIYG